MLSKHLITRAQADGTPLIDDNRVTFLWQGKKAPQLIGDFTDWENGRPAELVESGPSLWTYQTTFPLDDYLEYIFIDGDNRLYDPFNKQQDTDFLQQSYAVNLAGMNQLVAGLDALGLGHVPSKGNFLLASVGEAARINRDLLKRGVIVRPVGNYGLPEFLRVSVGLREQNSRFLDALKDCL